MAHASDEQLKALRERLERDLVARTLSDAEVADMRTTIAALDELAELRRVTEALADEFDKAVAHAEWRAAGSKGMRVPFHGDFAAATQLPSLVGRMRWWAREMRKALDASRTAGGGDG